MAQAFLAMTHMSHTSSAGLLQPEPGATLQCTRQGNLHIIQSDSSGLEYLAGSERGVGGGGWWSVAWAHWWGTQNSLVRVKVEQNYLSSIIGMLAFDLWWEKKSMTPLLCDFNTPPPPISTSHLSIFLINLLYMYEEAVVHPCVQWSFLWRTSLGSKPCSDSCLVNHLNKFSNGVPTSEVVFPLHCAA